jgi:hypothetical protein
VFSTTEKANELKGINAKQLEAKRKISPLVTQGAVSMACSRIAGDDELRCAHRKGLLSSAYQVNIFNNKIWNSTHIRQPISFLFTTRV